MTITARDAKQRHPRPRAPRKGEIVSETPTPTTRARIRWGWFVGCILLGLAAILLGSFVAPAGARQDYLAGVLANVGTTLLLVGVVLLLERRIIDSAVKVVRSANEQANDAIRVQIQDWRTGSPRSGKVRPQRTSPRRRPRPPGSPTSSPNTSWTRPRTRGSPPDPAHVTDRRRILRTWETSRQATSHTPSGASSTRCEGARTDRMPTSSTMPPRFRACSNSKMGFGSSDALSSAKLCSPAARRSLTRQPSSRTQSRARRSSRRHPRRCARHVGGRASSWAPWRRRC